MISSWVIVLQYITNTLKGMNLEDYEKIQKLYDCLMDPRKVINIFKIERYVIDILKKEAPKATNVLR